jgi:hypothetical protein
MSRIFLIAFLFASGFAVAQRPSPTQETRSLAERAAALHKKSPNDGGSASTQPQAKGANCDYKSVRFGLEIKCLDGWVGVSRGDLNGIKAVTRTRETIEFGMRSPDGNNVVVSLEPALYRKDPWNMKAALMEDTKDQLAQRPHDAVSIDLRDDPLVLSDATHQFVAVRLKTSAAIESFQLVALNGTAVAITITNLSNSEDEMKDMIEKLRAHIFWTTPRAITTP